MKKTGIGSTHVLNAKFVEVGGKMYLEDYFRNSASKLFLSDSRNVKLVQRIQSSDSF